MLCVAGCGHTTHAAPQPFAAGGIEAGPGSGLWGDGASDPTGQHLGCIAGRRFTLAVTLRNRSAAPVTVLDALELGPEPAPRIIRRVAVQLGLAALSRGDLAVTNLRRWSAAASRPVTIPPGRSAVVQSNFLMRHCDDLVPRQTLPVNRGMTVSYRSSGRVGTQEILQPSARILLTRGPAIRSCARVRGPAGLVAVAISCRVAGRAALGCLRHASGRCSAAGHAWNCTSTAPSERKSVERCWLDSKVQSFKVRWR